MDDYIKLLQRGLIDIDADRKLLPSSIDQEVKTFFNSDPDGTRKKNLIRHGHCLPTCVPASPRALRAIVARQNTLRQTTDMR